MTNLERRYSRIVCIGLALYYSSFGQPDPEGQDVVRQSQEEHFQS